MYKRLCVKALPWYSSSTAYNTSLIYCFVIWCLHTNQRRPCSSTLSGHPSSSLNHHFVHAPKFARSASHKNIQENPNGFIVWAESPPPRPIFWEIHCLANWAALRSWRWTSFFVEKMLNQWLGRESWDWEQSNFQYIYIYIMYIYICYVYIYIYINYIYMYVYIYVYIVYINIFICRCKYIYICISL